MAEKLSELLLRIMSSSCGIEKEQSFLTGVLSEIHKHFMAQAIGLFVKGGFEDSYEMKLHYPASGPCSGVLPIFTAQFESAFCGYQPIMCETLKGTQLILPLNDEKSPTMLLSLYWKDASPPGWISDSERLTAFSKELASYLSWKHMMLKMAAAKQNLEAIFDHMPEAVCVINHDNTIERVNRAFTEFFNIPFSEAVGKDCQKIIHGNISTGQSGLLGTALEKREEVRIETVKGKHLRITFLPLAAKNDEPESLQLFRKRDDTQGRRESTRSQDFFRLYDSLSQPMTVLSLISEMLPRESNGTFKVEYLDIIRKEISILIGILKEARYVSSMEISPVKIN